MKEMVGGCCVCSDDRGWSENPLVYCDGQSCAVAVHQACYGIVTVPSGPWYCRKCESQERSARVRCELCPSRDGALKRTDNQGWAHVVCALYIPEVRFGNVTTMEPIILQLIPQERYSKTCYICAEIGKGSRSTVGACMQCNKSGCKQQFHVTCAQQLGLLCEEAGNYLDNVKYCGYCQHHYSKLKKGGNVKTIPPYKPVNHETNSSDGPSSPEKELEPPSLQQLPSASGLTGSGSNSMKSNNRLPGDPSTSSSAASSSKQRKSSNASKSSTSTTATASSSTLVGSGNSSVSMSSQSISSTSTAITGMSSGSTSTSTTGGNTTKTSSSSSGSSNKDKDKYSKNVNKVSSTNKSHDKEPTSSSSSSSSSSQRDKSSKSSKSSNSSNTVNSSGTSGIGSITSNSSNASSNITSSLSKENELSSLSPSVSSASTMPSSSMKHQENGANKQEKTLAQISSAAASSARAASLSPAAIPTTLIIKPPHDHSGSNKELLSKEAIAKFTTSNFTETIVVNSDSVFGTSTTTSSTSGSGNSGSNSVVGSNPISTGSSIMSGTGPTSVIETGTGSGSGSSKVNVPGGNTYSTGVSGVAKKRKADARSTPTMLSSGDIDINRFDFSDLIKDVAVSLVPLPLNKNDNVDPATISGIEKSIKKAKTEPNSPHHPGGDPNIQNVSPNLIQSHASNVISTSIKHQQQPNSPQLLQPQQQLPQQQGQPHTPSLVVSVPLSTATVPGVNLPTSNSGSSSTSSSNNPSANNNAPSSSSSSNTTPNIVSPGQMPSGSSLYQQLTQRTGDQLMTASTNRSSPVIQQQPSALSHVIQNPAHSILERQSPSMRSSPAIITSAGSQHHQQQQNHPFSSGGMDLNPNNLSSNVSVLQSISPVPMSAIQSTSSSPIIPGGDGGLKITYEKQTPNSRIAALQEEEISGRRSRSQSRERGGGTGNGSNPGGGKTRTSKKRSLQQQQAQQQRSSPLINSGSSSSSSSSSANNAAYVNEPNTTSRSSTPINSHSSSHSSASNNNQLNLTLNSSSSNSSHTNTANGNSSNNLLKTSVGTTIVGPSNPPHSDKPSQPISSASSSATAAANTNACNNTAPIATSTITTPAASGTHVIEMVGTVSTSSNNFQNNHPSTGGQSNNLTTGSSTPSGNSHNSSHSGSNNTSSSLIAGTSTEHGHGTPSSNNTSSNSNNHNAVVVTHTSKKLRSSQPLVEIPSPSTSRTPDNSFGSNSSFSGGGGLKFSYEAQPTNPATIGATSTIITPQAMVKESPPSSPGSDSGMVRSNKRNRKLSTNSNAGAGAPESKESKLFQNGVVHATHMLGNQLNPNSSVAQKMSDQLSMEMETHTFIETAGPQLLGPQFPGKNQASRSSNATAPPSGGPSLSSMLSGGATATANGNTPQSLEQLLERQWEQGSQFLMEQAQHFDIASLLSCLHQLRSENIRLEDHVNNLVARRDHLLAVNARLAIPLNPVAMGGVGLGGGGGPGGPGGPGSTGGGSGTGSVGSQGQFNNMHGNGPHESGGNSTTATTISSRSSRIQQHQTQQQHSQSHFGSNTSNQVPLENGIDFRHSNSTHQNTNSSSSLSRQPSSSSGSGPTSEQQPSHPRLNRGMNSSGANSTSNSSNTGSSNSNTSSSSSVYQAQQQTIYNTAHQIPLLLEHHQQEHHSQQQLQQQSLQQPQPSQAHHLRQTSPTVSSRSHHTARAAGANPSASHSHHPTPLPHHLQPLTSAPSSHAPPPQQQPLPQRQRH